MVGKSNPPDPPPPGYYAAKPTLWQRFMRSWKLFFITHGDDHLTGEVALSNHQDLPLAYPNNSLGEDEGKVRQQYGIISADLLKLSSRVETLETNLGKLQDALRGLYAEPRESQEPRSSSVASPHTSRSTRPSPYDRPELSSREIAQLPTKKRPMRASDRGTPSWSSQTPPPTSSMPRVDFEMLEQAVCRFLIAESGAWEMERLLSAIQTSLGGDYQVEVKPLGPQTSGEWRLVILSPKESREGLVLVSAGELADDEISQYFEIEYGRRVMACRQPARVTRQGSDLVVARKGTVSSS